MPPNIVLIGYRGTGKSTVGRALAEHLGYTLIDTDEEVEARSGHTIAEIFATGGEPAFRDLEAQVLAEVTSGTRQVLSLGGGAVLREENRPRIRSCGMVIWLTATVETIATRIGRDPGSQSRRPQLTDLQAKDEITSVLAARLPLYESMAEVTVPTDDRTTAEIAETIIAEIADADGTQTTQ